MSNTGELAALGTAACWALTAVFFSAAGRRVGSLAVNYIRLLIAFGMLSIVGWLARGLPLPVDATPHAWTWLSVSGVVGFAFGDLCLFRAFVILGPRLSSLVMSLAPPITALIGWLVLGETLSLLDALGMSLTVGGIAWAVGARRLDDASLPERPTARGVLLAVAGALGQAGGLVLSKLGMGDYDPFAATQVRIIAGAAAFTVIFFATRSWPRVWAALQHKTGMTFTALGAVFGPFLGVSLSLLAVQHTQTGVAASIMATSPILIIPIVVVFRGERVGLGGIGGAVVAVAGVILLFMSS